MKIVIIDSGIQIDHKCFSGLKCASYEVKRNNKDYLLVSCDGTDSIGHGCKFRIIGASGPEDRRAIPVETA